MTLCFLFTTQLLWVKVVYSWDSSLTRECLCCLAELWWQATDHKALRHPLFAAWTSVGFTGLDTKSEAHFWHWLIVTIFVVGCSLCIHVWYEFAAVMCSSLICIFIGHICISQYIILCTVGISQCALLSCDKVCFCYPMFCLLVTFSVSLLVYISLTICVEWL